MEEADRYKGAKDISVELKPSRLTVELRLIREELGIVEMYVAICLT